MPLFDSQRGVVTAAPLRAALVIPATGLTRRAREDRGLALPDWRRQLARHFGRAAPPRPPNPPPRASTSAAQVEAAP
jgi:hypothetical protein